MAHIHECQLCGASFERSYDLRRHILIHSEDKPFKCTICGHQAAQKSNLQKHMNSHTGEKPYKCEVKGCSKSYTEPGSLTRHKKSAHRYQPPDRRPRTQPKVPMPKRPKKPHSHSSKAKQPRPPTPTPEFIPPGVSQTRYYATPDSYDDAATRSAYSRFSLYDQSSSCSTESDIHYSSKSQHSSQSYFAPDSEYHSPSSSTYSYESTPSSVDEEPPLFQHPLRIGFPSPRTYKH